MRGLPKEGVFTVTEIITFKDSKPVVRLMYFESPMFLDNIELATDARS
jgi:hypothetical protein